MTCLSQIVETHGKCVEMSPCQSANSTIIQRPRHKPQCSYMLCQCLSVQAELADEDNNCADWFFIKYSIFASSVRMDTQSGGCRLRVMVTDERKTVSHNNTLHGNDNHDSAFSSHASGLVSPRLAMSDIGRSTIYNPELTPEILERLICTSYYYQSHLRIFQSPYCTHVMRHP